MNRAVNSADEACVMCKSHNQNQLPPPIAIVSSGCVNSPSLKKTNNLEHPVKSKELQKNANYFSK